MGLLALLADFPGFWGLAFTGFASAIALKTAPLGGDGQRQLHPVSAVRLPHHGAPLPLEAMTGWMATVARFNPMTYLLAALRSLLYGGWDFGAIGGALAAIAIVGTISIGLALAALRRRVRIP